MSLDDATGRLTFCCQVNRISTFHPTAQTLSKVPRTGVRDVRHPTTPRYLLAQGISRGAIPAHFEDEHSAKTHQPHHQQIGGNRCCRFTLELTYMAPLDDARSISETIQSSMDEVGICVDLNGIDDRAFACADNRCRVCQLLSPRSGRSIRLAVAGTHTPVRHRELKSVIPVCYCFSRQCLRGRLLRRLLGRSPGMW